MLEGLAISHRSSARKFPAPNVKVELKVPSGLRCALRGGPASERAKIGGGREDESRGWFGSRGAGSGRQWGGSGGGCSSFEHRASFEQRCGWAYDSCKGWKGWRETCSPAKWLREGVSVMDFERERVRESERECERACEQV